MNKDCMKGSRANELRYKYLRKIKEAYEKFDFSDLFDDIAEDCSWSGARQGRRDRKTHFRRRVHEREKLPP